MKTLYDLIERKNKSETYKSVFIHEKDMHVAVESANDWFYQITRVRWKYLRAQSMILNQLRKTLPAGFWTITFYSTHSGLHEDYYLNI